MSFQFVVAAREEAARAGTFSTPHGNVATPAFMAVVTLATVKALDPMELEAMGAQMILANAYHLHLRPGDALVRELGGLHAFMGWSTKTASSFAVTSTAPSGGSRRSR